MVCKRLIYFVINTPSRSFDSLELSLPMLNIKATVHCNLLVVPKFAAAELSQLHIKSSVSLLSLILAFIFCPQVYQRRHRDIRSALSPRIGDAPTFCPSRLSGTEATLKVLTHASECVAKGLPQCNNRNVWALA